MLAAEALAQRFDRGDAVAQIEVIVGDDDVGRAERVERRIASSSPCAVATRQPQRLRRTRMPSSTRGSLSMARTLSPASGSPAATGSGATGLRAPFRRRASERRGDEEHRALARAGAQADGMLEHPPQTLDDRQAQPKAARHPRALVEPLELGEHRALMLGRDAEAGVPDLDARGAGHAAAADQHPAARAYI